MSCLMFIISSPFWRYDFDSIGSKNLQWHTKGIHLNTLQIYCDTTNWIFLFITLKVLGEAISDLQAVVNGFTLYDFKGCRVLW